MVSDALGALLPSLSPWTREQTRKALAISPVTFLCVIVMAHSHDRKHVPEPAVAIVSIGFDSMSTCASF